MSLPRILQRLEKLEYRVNLNARLLKLPLTDILVDHNHSMSGLRGSNSTVVVSKQFNPLCQRDVTFALSNWYDAPFLLAKRFTTG
jgi:hypothetical protein